MKAKQPWTIPTWSHRDSAEKRSDQVMMEAGLGFVATAELLAYVLRMLFLKCTGR